MDALVHKGFLHTYLGVARRPMTGLQSVLNSPNPLRSAGLAMTMPCVVYQLVYWFLARNGGRPTVFRPWLAIDAEHYYRYNQLWIVPSILLAWICASGVTQVVARALGGSGSFEEMLVVLGFGISISSWWTGLHDLLTTAMGFLGVIDQRAYEDALSGPTPFRTFLWVLMVGYMAWFFWTFVQGAKVAHRLNALRAAVVGSSGVVAYQLVFVLFNR